MATKTQAELEEQLRVHEAEMAKHAEEGKELKDLNVFDVLRPGWRKAIEDGSIDWDDLLGRLDEARATALRLR